MSIPGKGINLEKDILNNGFYKKRRYDIDGSEKVKYDGFNM